MSVNVARRAVEDSGTYQNLIGGKWQAAADGRTVDMVSPSDGQAFARIARGSKADVDAAVKAARHAFEEDAWGKLTAVERGRLMTKLGEAILASHEELSRLEARDCGKPMKQARAGTGDGQRHRSKRRADVFGRQPRAGAEIDLRQIRCSGGRAVQTGGFYVAPVLFGPVPRDNALACDEVFGPVLSIIAFEDEADAVKLAREKGMEALHEFSHTKTIVFKHG